MSIRNQLANAVDSSTTGVKHSYTVPLKGSAKIRHTSWFNTNGTPTVRLEIDRGGTVHVVKEITASFDGALDIRLQAGDIIQWNVTVLAASGTADVSFSVDELSGNQ